MREKYLDKREQYRYTTKMTDTYHQKRRIHFPDRVRRPRASRAARLPLHASEAIEDCQRVDPDFDDIDLGDLMRDLPGGDRTPPFE